MPEFRYEAVDPSGVEVAATTYSSDPETVIADLVARGYQVHRVEETDVDFSAEEASRRVPRRPRHGAPPQPPRDVPKRKFSMARPGTFNIFFGVLFGGIGVLVGGIQGIAAVATGEAGLFVGAAIGALFGLIGGTFVYFGLRTRLRRKRVLELGTTTQATVTSTGLDTSLRINGRHPFKMEYEFRTADGRLAEGSARTFDDTITEYVDGEPIWVVFDPDKPEQNSLWPPF